MAREGYSEVLLSDFLLNAGVVGLIRLFRYADDYGGGCREGEDYIIAGQRLYISNEFLMTRDLAALYVEAMVHYMVDDTHFSAVLGKKGALDALYADPKPKDKNWREKVDGLFKEFTEMLLKASFKSGYAILAEFSHLEPPTEEMAAALKSEPDCGKKKARYDALHALLQQPKVREVLCFKEIQYSRLNMFMEGVSFFNRANAKKDITAAYRDYFITPLTNELAHTGKKPKKCLICGSDAKQVTPMSFLVDVADDVSRKKSYYWACNPDAYLCPLCAFISSLAPLGFAFVGEDGIFINNNSDIETLLAYADAVRESSNVEGGTWYRVFNALTSEKLRQLSNRATNIQVIIREKRVARYALSTVDRRTVGVFDSCAKPFERLKNRYAKDGKDYINVYQETVENVVGRRSQFPLIARLIRIAFGEENSPTDYVFNILLIQIVQQGGGNVEAKTKRAYAAKREGERLRARLTEGLPEADKDNKLRGLVYQMLSAVSLGNRDKFMELALRTYSGQNLPVPDIFFACFGGDEDFKEIGFAYLLGLKSAAYKKEEEAQ